MNNDPITLAQLLPEAGRCPDIPIEGIATDSGRVGKNYLFIALTGRCRDGRDYITAALRRGAAAVLVEKDQRALPVGAEIFAVPNLRWQVGSIADRFFDYPAREMRLTGVTGTKGKSSVCHWVSEVLGNSDHCSGTIGSLGCWANGEPVAASQLTMPTPIELREFLDQLRRRSITEVMLECSSQGLAEGRGAGLCFDTAIFTNLGSDHLDYHGDRKSYLQAKLLLFNSRGLRRAVINADDAAADHFYSQTTASEKIRYSVTDSDAEVKARDWRFSKRGIEASIDTPWGQATLHSKLSGKFNLSNLLAVIAAAGGGYCSLEQIVDRCNHLSCLPGRMQKIVHLDRTQLQIYVDYAHTPESLQSVLQALRPLCDGQLWCIFGCGGERDRYKRPAMGRVAEGLADRIILTMDNPRGEHPGRIFADIQAGMDEPAQVIIDRCEAIHFAISSAAIDDLILIAGKGQESYQEIGTMRYAHSDAEYAAHC